MLFNGVLRPMVIGGNLITSGDTHDDMSVDSQLL